MNKYHWAGVLVAFVALIAFASANMYARWQQDQYFGEILRISGSELVLRDRRVGERSVHFSPETRIRRGAEKGQAVLTEGERVIVFGNERAGVIEATLIRVVGDDDWGSGALPNR